VAGVERGIVVEVSESFIGLIGIVLGEVGEERARCSVEVRRELLQPGGVVHGGVYASIAETIASWATASVVAAEGSTALGLSNSTSFLRPISAGSIHALATRRHRGRTTWVWDVDMSDDEGRLCASSRVTVAVRARDAA
jgi:uncharacterized protein (TIGR00369 family)